MRICFALLVISILAVAQVNRSVAADIQADRFALVIGNAKYPDADAPLKEPINDARDVADELKRDGFNVEIGENLTGDAMRRAFDRLYGKVKPGSVVLIFFSGFGIQAARQSYMIPVDAQIWTEPDVRRDGFSLEAVLSEINNRGAGVKIALLDASRRNPFERRFRSFSAGLAPVIAPNGTLVMYSAALGSVVSDNGGNHSLFVQELLKEIRVPGLMAEETLNRTRVGVTRASRSEQMPWISSSLADDFAFIPGAAPSANPSPPRPTNPVIANTQPASPPSPQIEPPPVTKPAEIPVAPAVKPEPKGDSKSDSQTATSLADDPIIKSLTDKLIQNPDDANALYRRGQVYASKGAYSLAITDFSDSLRLNSKDVEAYNNRCWARTVIGELQAALKDCNEALRLRPSFVDALDSRGLLNLKSGQTKNAIADFDAALKLNPRLTSSLYGRGLAKQRNGAVSEGERDIANAKAMDPNIVKEYASYGVN
ncbi:MAG: caspase family protein [Bradyrhizobium sp.]|uniref:caspase family protein n=1 Tax=Bradyrhizobium sp. TaxID=376 RepID=UPI001C28BF69|nr:caspase family protein [Bradyrhizobium sp.]MBU6463888.1 caspase family protein [Pseudomonadota bacterium]MDE2065866.1 caspase family protein [Bradyrhizobium sp.]MDE2241614.1 caspase family protein [Bradyrhizobium sp.]